MALSHTAVGPSSVEVKKLRFKNNEGSTLPVDAVVQLDVSTAGVDGINVVQPNTGELNLTVGVLDVATANGEFGLVQVSGYRATSIVLITDTTLANGLKLTPVAGQNYLASLAAGDGRDGWFALCESHTTGTGTVSKKIHIRCGL